MHNLNLLASGIYSFAGVKLLHKVDITTE